MGSTKPRAAAGLACAVVTAVAAGAWYFFSPAPQAARLPDSAGSTRPDDGFVGSQSCAACHPGEAVRHSRSGHARTLTETSRMELARDLDGKSFFDAERGETFHYHFTAGGLMVTLPEKFNEKPFPLTYAFGSGEHAVTFLSLIPNRSGEPTAVEHRVSVFGPERRLALTPNHTEEDVTQAVEEFGRIRKGAVLERCFGCHTTTGKIAGESLVDLRANVGCENCHGPGARHISSVEQKQDDLAILFGKGGHSAGEQIRMCGTCHRNPDQLNPEDIRPDNRRLPRFQPVGLLQSACYKKSAGRLTCTTCHDPHEHAPREREQFDGRCLNCHSEGRAETLICRVSPRENCVSCHMPAVEVRPGTAFHDHWIRRRNGQLPSEPAPEKDGKTGESD
jgi:Cytochrome c554 and c-prime